MLYFSLPKDGKEALWTETQGHYWGAGRHCCITTVLTDHNTRRKTLRPGAAGTSKAFSGRASRPGTYVCNAVFYTLMDAVNHTIPAGFIHVPKTMETSRLTQALGTAVQIALPLSSCSDHSC